MTARKKILYIDTPLDPPGGGQVSLLNILKNIDFEKVVFVPYECLFTKMLKENDINYKIVGIKNLFSAIKNFSPDIIHCNSATTRYTFFSAVIAKMLNIPFIWHNRVVETAGWKEKVIAKLSTKIIVISDAVKEKFSFIRNNNKVVKIHNAVNSEEFKPGLDIEYLYKELNITKNSKIIGMLSRLDPRKGHKLFLEAARKVKDNLGNTVVFLVLGSGDENYKGKLMQLTDKLQLKNDVIFVGFRDDMSEMINLCDIVINPSILPEAFGRTIIEAMSCEKPVIATNLGGPKEIIDNGVDGFLVQPTAIGITEVLLEILSDDKLRNEIGKNARKKVIEKFNIIQQVKTIETLYEQMMKWKRYR